MSLLHDLANFSKEFFEVSFVDIGSRPNATDGIGVDKYQGLISPLPLVLWHASPHPCI